MAFQVGRQEITDKHFGGQRLAPERGIAAPKEES